MNKNIKLTPKQLKILVNHLIDFYEKDFSLKKTNTPHYEHVSIGRDLYKIGFIPSEDNTPNIISIRIVYKGKANG